LGRVAATSNPYRENETVYWSKPRYDELNRVVETYAPAIEGQTGASLGITEFGISNVQDFVGTYTTATDASGRRARSITNALGQLVRIDEPTGTNNDLGLIGSPNQPTYYKYNSQGKMVHVQQGKTGETIQHRYFLYDYLGRLIRVKQPEQEVNSNLNTTQTVDGNNEWTAKMEYDIVGNLIKTTDAEGKTITNFYDKASRVIKREYSNLDTPTVFYHYDGTGLATPPPTTLNFAKGKLTKVSSTISASLFTSFDNFGRVLTHQQITDNQTYNTAYKYNLSGALLEETYPSTKVVRNFFESDGDLTKIVRNGKVYASDFSYTSAGAIERLKLGNGLWESAKMNARQQVEEINLGISPTDASKWQIKYEYGELTANGTIQNSGNITKQTINFAGLAQPFVQTYKYDASDRIIEAKENNGTATGTQNWKQTYNYDRFGNRTAFSQVIGTTTLAINNQTLPSVDPLTNRFNTGQGFEYDKAGNITKDSSNAQVREFIFNGDNKQVHIKDANGVPIGTYFYNGEGKRVKKTTTSETTIFVYNAGGEIVAEYSTVQANNPTVSYTATDPLGSPRVITDKSGNVISRRDFMPFGEELNANIATNRLDTQKYNGGEDNVRKRFTGYEKDQETGLDFAEARYYNNRFGRFTAVDPLLASGKSNNPQTFNRYTYTMNQPTTMTDKSGLQAVWAFRDRAGGTDVEFLDISQANKLGDTKYGKETGFVPWKQWAGGNFWLTEGKMVYKLIDNGKTGYKLPISMEGFSGTDEQWGRVVGEWFAGKKLEDIDGGAWLSSVEAAKEYQYGERNGIFRGAEGIGMDVPKLKNSLEHPIFAVMAPEFQLANNSRLAGIAARNSTVNALAQSTVSGVKGNQKFALGVDFSSGRVFSATSGGAYNAPLSFRARIGLTFANLTGGSRHNCSLTNCAEFRLCNNAANAGVRRWNFTFTTVDKDAFIARRCFNCQITTPVLGTAANGNKPRF
jgi:RHS repeat-associated protein